MRRYMEVTQAQLSPAEPKWTQPRPAKSSRTTTSLHPSGNTHKEWMFVVINYWDTEVVYCHSKNQLIHSLRPSRPRGLTSTYCYSVQRFATLPVAALHPSQAFINSFFIKDSSIYTIWLWFLLRPWLVPVMFRAENIRRNHKEAWYGVMFTKL